MDNFKFYALTRFKLEVSASTCFTELKKAHRTTAPSRATVFRWFGEFKEDPASDDSEVTVTMEHGAWSRLCTEPQNFEDNGSDSHG